MATPPELRLKRFIHIGDEIPTYRPGLRFKSDLLQDNRTTVESFIVQAKDKDVINIILKAFTDGYSIRPEALILALAVATRQESEQVREAAYLAARTICAAPEDLFLFISYVRQLVGGPTMPKGVVKLVSAWYMNQEPMDLLHSVLEYNKGHGWNHKDLLRVCHVKTKTNPGIFAVTTYICKGLNKMKLDCADTPEAKPVIAYLEALTAYRALELKADSTETLRILRAHDIPFKQVSNQAHHLKWVWLEFIPKMPLRFLLEYLKRLGHLRDLNVGFPIADAFVKALTNQESIAKSDLHPAEVLIARRSYENIINLHDEAKRRQPNHTKPEEQPPLEINPAVVEALNVLLTSTFKLAVPTGQRYLVVVDSRPEMTRGQCYQSNRIKPLMAAALLALSLVRTERSVTVGTFGPAGSVHTLRFGKNASLQDAHDKLAAADSCPVDLSQPISWAEQRGKEVDVFLLITDKQVKQEQLASPAKAIQQYRKQMKRPLAKLVVCGLSCIVPFNIADPQDHGMLDIVGFDGKVPRAIEAFSRGAF